MTSVSRDPFHRAGDLPRQRGEALLQEVISTDGDPAKALALIARGADVTRCDRHGLSALCWAARQGYADVVAALVAAGADVNHASGQNWQPLHWAAVSGSIGAAEAILAKKPDVNAKNDNNDTALTLATLIDGDSRKGFAELLLSHGADVTLRGANGMSPLDSAQDNHQEDLVALFTQLVENLKPATSAAAIESATTLKKPLRPMKAAQFRRHR